eukprot:TRINITY_DN92404_c0_g1_i1.p1 TRINITY_DN92404_c0_g1~~TRINITY_DN92404_c0_g1_i1.p1  ORF type:complete len:762 (+),score=132.55 TRINITY_DN92404_c0_g1_i1:69-2354(+)
MSRSNSCMVSRCSTLGLVLVASADFVGKVQLDIEVSASCEPGNLITLEHPLCRNSPLFPAMVMQVDAADGNATLYFGWSSRGQDAWTRPTLLPLAGANSYDCLEADWKPDGEVGRGYDYEPSCDPVSCITGCIVSPPSGCVGSPSRLELGDVCLVRCGGENKDELNLTCDGAAWPELRSFECRPEITFCDEVNGTANTTGCVARGGSQTTTEELVLGDRLFRGCSEFQQLADGVVGMPDNLMSSGSYYFEVEVQDPSEVVGFADSLWSAGEDEHSWKSSPPAGKVGPGCVGAAVRFVKEGKAEVRFAWDGAWGPSRTIEFAEPLIPVAFATQPISWRIVEDAWIFKPPDPRFRPLTQQRFPLVCHFPPEYMMMDRPPLCREDFISLTTPQACAVAALHLGFREAFAHEGNFVGWPANCFYCRECGLSGDLYWNTAASENTSSSSIRQAPDAAAICIRRPPEVQQDEATTTTSTTVVDGAVDDIFETMPEYRTAFGTCQGGYLHVFSLEICVAAARELGLLFNGKAIVVNLPKGQGGSMSWPDGCFYCPLCDTGHLFFNGIPSEEDPCKDSESPDCNSSSPAVRNASKSNEESNDVGVPTEGNAILAQPICRAPPELLVTPEPPPSTSFNKVLPITTTALDSLERIDEAELTTTDDFGVTTELVAEPGVYFLGDMTCDNPHVIERVLEWWERPELMSLIAFGTAGFCTLCGCLWFWGICHKACGCIRNRLCCCCPCCKRRERKEEPIFFNPALRQDSMASSA